jgi:hypothetical protein
MLEVLDSAPQSEAITAIFTLQLYQLTGLLNNAVTQTL